jgi:hypothetical protein
MLAMLLDPAAMNNGLKGTVDKKSIQKKPFK